MCMHWLKHVRLNRKDRLKNMRGTTLEVTMLADVSEALNAISNVYSTLICQQNVNLDDLLWIKS